MEELIFVWETICEVGEAWLILGGLAGYGVWRIFRKKLTNGSSTNTEK